MKGKGERNVYALEEGRIGTELRPLTQGYNRLVKGGQVRFVFVYIKMLLRVFDAKSSSLLTSEFCGRCRDGSGKGGDWGREAAPSI